MKTSNGHGGDAAKKTVIVTTSWDDGHRDDLKVAELLSARKLPGTFYVTSGSLGDSSHMSASKLRELAEAGFEIGGHTVSHPVLTEIDSDHLKREIVDCKSALEAALGRELVAFAYPKGKFNAAVVNEVKQAGFRCARGVRLLSFARSFPPFAMPVTIQAHPHRWPAYWRNLIKRGQIAALAKSSVMIGRSANWVELGKALFDCAQREGGAWHLVGHSWETEKENGWAELKEMLDYVSGRPGVRYMTNGELGRLVARTRSA
jgi:peptidoglycan-N-acetylglucosamine deacetylase